jgi:hypothetical protein
MCSHTLHLIMVIKLRMMRWARNVERIEEMKNVGKPQKENHLGKLRPAWESNTVYRVDVQCFRMFYVVQSHTTTVIHSSLKTSVFILYYSRYSSFVRFFFSFFLHPMPYSSISKVSVLHCDVFTKACTIKAVTDSLSVRYQFPHAEFENHTQIYSPRTDFLTKLNFCFHECDSREPKLRTVALCVKCCKQCMYSFFTIVTFIFHFTY